jgi:single-strand DNA-binding protein
MPGFNRVMLIGNLTRDPQIKRLSSNTTVADFGLAMNRRYRTQSGEEKEDVCFIDCAAFGKQADVIGQYCRKGKQLFVEGRLKYDTWDDKSGCGKRSKLSVVVENFQFLGGRDDAATHPGRQRTFADVAARQSPEKAKVPAGDIADDEGFTNADIPF